MSIHLLECAANLPLPASTKLALMAFADSADRHTHIAMPGIDQVQRWSNLGRSRASEVVAELVAQGLLRKHRAAHRGRRAEYVVFPEGCCDEHRRAPEDGSAQPDPFDQKGPGEPESLSVNGSAVPDPIPARPANGSAAADPLTEKGSGKGPTATGPLPSYRTTTPPSPRTAGGDRCAKPGPTPHANCRGCGTTNRQLADRARRETAEQRRQAAQQEVLAQRERAAAESRPADAVRSLLDQTRRAISASRSTR